VKTQLSFIEESVHEALAIVFYDGGVMKTPSPFAIIRARRDDGRTTVRRLHYVAVCSKRPGHPP